MLTNEQFNYVVSSAINNAWTTVYIEKAQPTTQVGQLAADSVIDSLEANCLTATDDELKALQTEARRGAFLY